MHPNFKACNVYRAYMSHGGYYSVLQKAPLVSGRLFKFALLDILYKFSLLHILYIYIHQNFKSKVSVILNMYIFNSIEYAIKARSVKTISYFQHTVI